MSNATREPRTCGDCGGTFVPSKWTKSRCSKCRYARERENRRANYEQWRDNGGLEHLRNAHLVRKYGITSADLEAMVAAQGGMCPICKATEPGGRGNWHVDHDHSCCPTSRTCGKCIRGALCSKCNQALGLFQDDTDRLRVAIAYLDRKREGW